MHSNIDPKGTLLSVLFAYPPSLQSRRNFGERVLSIFQRQLWPPSLILMAVVSWGEKEIFTKGVGDDQNKERGGDGENISPFAPPPPSDASISKSYMAG